MGQGMVVIESTRGGRTTVEPISFIILFGEEGKIESESIYKFKQKGSGVYIKFIVYRKYKYL